MTTVSTQQQLCDEALLAKLPELAGWSSASQEILAQIDRRTAGMIAAMLDQVTPKNGDVLPPLWHWAYFLTPAPQRDIADDGHPQKGGFLPPIMLSRRMFAGSRIMFRRDLVVGETYRRRAQVTAVDVKQGRSGKLAFVKVRNTVFGRGEVMLEEEQDIVYREPQSVNAPPALSEVKSWQWREDTVADPVMLFRYSAVTFNAHRIHYDLPYATQEEGYPGLVVHGTLLATFMAELVRKRLPGARIAQFRFSGKRPVFASQSFQVAGNLAADGRSVDLAILSGGVEATVGHVTFEESASK